MSIEVIDISVSEDFMDGPQEIFAVVRPHWNWKNVKFHAFTTGITNTIMGFYLDTDEAWTDMVLIRRYGRGTDLLIDRVAEKRNMKLLHEFKCGPPLYAILRNGIVYGFVPGKCVDSSNVTDEEISLLIAREMAKMHLIDINDNPDFDTSTPYLFRKLNSFLQILPAQLSNPEYQVRWERLQLPVEQLKKECDELQAVVEKHSKSPKVFCHNDLLLENVVYNDTKRTVTFIDYEYGDYNYEYFDIADHFTEFPGVSNPIDYTLYPDKDFQIDWLRKFFSVKAELQGSKPEPLTDEALDAIYDEVNLFALCAHILWGIWALIQAENSLIDYDFIGFAESRLGEYLAKKDQFMAFVKQ